MSRGSRRFIVLALVLPPLVAAVGGRTASAGPADRDAIRTTLKRMWDATTSLEVHGEEYLCDEAGRRVTEGTYTHRFDFFFATNGRRALRRIMVAPDGRLRLSEDLREDGRRLYSTTAFPDDPDAVDSITVHAQTDTVEDHRSFRNCLALWLWTPDGRPLHAWVDAASSLEEARDETGREIVVLTAPCGAKVLRCELDPAHAWLARRVRLEGSMEVVATRFARDNGHWFPAEGTWTQEHKREGRANWQGFRVTSLRINRPLPSSTFSLPPITEGVVVFDETGGRSKIQGGIEARKRLIARHPDDASRSPGAAESTPAPPIVAPRGPDRSRWGVVLFTAAILALIAAWRLRSR